MGLSGEIVVLAGLFCHFISQGNALRLCGKHNIKLGHLLEKLFSAGYSQFYIREHDEAGDGEIFVKRADIEVALKTCDLKTIGFTHRKNFLSIFLNVRIISREANQAHDLQAYGNADGIRSGLHRVRSL